MLARTLLVVFLTLVSTNISRAEVVVISDQPYHEGPGAEARHKLDLYIPKGKKDYPVLVFIHGGAWMFGSKDILGLYPALAKCLAENGIGVVLPNYRLSPTVKHPAHIQDIARAFAWVHKNIKNQGGDPQKIFIGGHSAGGHLAALLATDESYLRAFGLSREAIRGVVALSGVYRIPENSTLTPAVLAGSGVTSTMAKLGINPFDVVFEKDAASRKQASPVSHVVPGLPPFLVLYAEFELPMLDTMALEFAEALKGKADVTLDRISGRSHQSILMQATKVEDPVVRMILAFLSRKRQ